MTCAKYDSPSLFIFGTVHATECTINHSLIFYVCLSHYQIPVTLHRCMRIQNAGVYML